MIEAERLVEVTSRGWGSGESFEALEQRMGSEKIWLEKGGGRCPGLEEGLWALSSHQLGELRK